MSEKIVIREATLADGPILAELERRSPLVMGETKLVIERGDDYWAAARLMGDYTAIVAEVDGQPAGVFGGALHRAMIGATARSLVYVNHARILPEFQDRGLGKRLAEGLRKAYQGRFESMYWYIAPENTHSQAFARRANNHWTIRPGMLLVDTARFAAPPVGRVATPADAELLVSLFNAAHEGEEMFLPYAVEGLGERLARAPGQYGWSNVRVHGNAAVGAWFEGDYFRVRLTEADGTVSESRAGAILDFGYLPGGEEDLLALVGAWCGILQERGMTDLSVFSCPGTRHWELLSGLAEPGYMDFWTPEIAQPEGSKGRGLYVDHVYF